MTEEVAPMWVTKLSTRKLRRKYIGFLRQIWRDSEPGDAYERKRRSDYVAGVAVVRWELKRRGEFF